MDISLPICANKFIEVDRVIDNLGPISVSMKHLFIQESIDGTEKPVGKVYKKNVEKEEKSKHLSKKERMNSKKLKKQVNC